MPLDPSQHVSDLHQMVIHDIGEVICREAVRLDDDWVPLGGKHIVTELTIDKVIELLHLGGEEESYCVWETICEFLLDLVWMKVVAFSVILVRLFRLGSFLLE